MILLTEEQITSLGQSVIEFLDGGEETEWLTIGEWITILATAIFMLGQSTTNERP